MSTKFRMNILFLLTVCLAVGFAWAQDAPEQAAEEAVAQEAADDRPIEEVIVTARKTEESLDDVPLTLQAFTADQIQDVGISSIENIADFTPGLHFGNYQAQRDEPELKFRGMDVGSRSRTIQNASGFIDGVYLPGSTQVISMEDVDRVEVVKGPQSAFFGRQTFAGAVNLITKSPSFEWKGDLSLTGGENGRIDLNAGVGGPISDAVSFRIFGRYFDYDGGWDNPDPGSDTLGGLSTNVISASLGFAPSDNSDVKLRVMFSEDDDDGGAYAFFRSSILNCGPFGDGTSMYYCGELDLDLADPVGYDTTVNFGAEGTNWPKDDFGMEREFTLATLDFDVVFGDTTLTSVTSYLQEEVDVIQDFTGTDSLLLAYANTDTLVSQELRLAGTTDRWDWLVGGYYLDAEYEDDGAGWGCGNPNYWGCFPFTFGVVRGHFDLTFEEPTKITNTALFGAVTYRASDKLSLSLEGRAANEEIDEGTVTGTDGSVNVLKADTDSFTPRFILDWKPDYNTTVYFNAALGNKAAGFNDDMADMAAAAIAAFEAQLGAGLDVPEEELITYELGLRRVFANGRHRIHAAAYLIDWSDQRLRQFEQGFDTNADGVVDDTDEFQIDYDTIAGETEITGLEFFYSGALGEYFDVNLSFNLNNPEYKKFNDSTHGSVFGTRDASGKKVPRSPEESAVFGLGFQHPFGSGDWDFYARTDATYTGSSYTWAVNLAETGDATRVNLRLGLRNDRYDFSVWANNLTDDDTLTAIRRFTDFWTFGQGFWAGLPLPREIGVTLRYRFN